MTEPGLEAPAASLMNPTTVQGTASVSCPTEFVWNPKEIDFTHNGFTSWSTLGIPRPSNPPESFVFDPEEGSKQTFINIDTDSFFFGSPENEKSTTRKTIPIRRINGQKPPGERSILKAPRVLTSPRAPSTPPAPVVAIPPPIMDSPLSTSPPMGSMNKRTKRKKDQAFSMHDSEDIATFTEPDTNIDGTLLNPPPLIPATKPATFIPPAKIATPIPPAKAASIDRPIVTSRKLLPSDLKPTVTKGSPQKTGSPSKPTSSLPIAKRIVRPIPKNGRIPATPEADGNHTRPLLPTKHPFRSFAREFDLGDKKKKKTKEIEEKEKQEREKIKEFWLSLTDDQRRELVKLEKEAVLKKMKEQQKHTCSCSVCGRRRTVIEEELEMLYDAYYEELEHFEKEKKSSLESEDEGFNFAKSLTVKGGILTVADDLLKNEGKKFLDMMEKLAERRVKRDERDSYDESETDEDYDDEYDEEETEELTEEQRLEEGRKMFQIFAAKMFEQRVLHAYREKVARENQEKLIKEEEEQARLEKERKEAKLKKQQERKERREKARQLAQQQKEKERKEKEEQERKRQEELKKQQEENRRKQLELKRKQEEEERKRREEEERIRMEKEKKLEEERAKKEKAKKLELESEQNGIQKSNEEKSASDGKTGDSNGTQKPSEENVKKKKKKKKKNKKPKPPQEDISYHFVSNSQFAPNAKKLASASTTPAESVQSDRSNHPVVQTNIHQNPIHSRPSYPQAPQPTTSSFTPASPFSQYYYPSPSQSQTVSHQPNQKKMSHIEEDDDSDITSLLQNLLPAKLDEASKADAELGPTTPKSPPPVWHTDIHPPATNPPPRGVAPPVNMPGMWTPPTSSGYAYTAVFPTYVNTGSLPAARTMWTPAPPPSINGRYPTAYIPNNLWQFTPGGPPQVPPHTGGPL